MSNLLKSFWGLFGKKQWIGIYLATLSLVVACISVWMSATSTVNDLLGFLQVWFPAAVTAVTVPAMVTDSVRARNGK